jgi:hypothetical protein
MRFYNCQHRHYCGIDLHVKTMYVCILDATGQVLIHRTIKSTPRRSWGSLPLSRRSCRGRRMHVPVVLARRRLRWRRHRLRPRSRARQFSEAAVLYLRHAPGGKKLLGDIEKKHRKGKALSILAHKIGRAVFCMLSRRTVFSMDKFRAA